MVNKDWSLPYLCEFGVRLGVLRELIVVMKTFSICLMWLLLQCVCASRSFRQRCLSFSPEKSIFNSTLTVLEHLPAGTNLTLADNDKTCARPYQVVSADICRAALHVPTSNRSSITMELWLPEKWESGRVLASGNGGIDGCSSNTDVYKVYSPC